MTNLAAAITEIGDKFTATASDLASRLSELEKRAARERPRFDNDNDSSLGDLVANSDEVRDLTAEFRGKRTINVGDEFSIITSGAGSVGGTTSAGTSLVPGHRVPGIVAPYERPLRVRDLFATSKTVSNSVEFGHEASFTNNSRPVTEGTTKPYSDLTFNLKTVPVRTVAHLFKASRQILDDASVLASYINRRGIYGLELTIENQLLNGSGTGQNLHGLLPQATAFTAPYSASTDTALDTISQAIAQVEEVSAPVNGIVMHPTDWRRLIGTKDNEHRYLARDVPFGSQAHNLWGYPVVTSLAVEAGEFVVGAFNLDAEIFERMETQVFISTENADDFEKNLVSILIETRLAMAVYRPTSFVTGELPVASE